MPALRNGQCPSPGEACINAILKILPVRSYANRLFTYYVFKTQLFLIIKQLSHHCSFVVDASRTFEKIPVTAESICYNSIIQNLKH